MLSKSTLLGVGSYEVALLVWEIKEKPVTLRLPLRLKKNALGWISIVTS